jgi:hypothetical protein
MFRDYLEVLRKAEVPKIPTSLAITEDVFLPSTNGHRYLASIDAKRICLAEHQLSPSRSKTADALAQEVKHNEIEERVITIRALPALKPELDRPLWPAPDDATKVDTVEVVSDTVEDFDTERGAIERHRVVKIRACAARPAITASTRFLAITIHDIKQEPKVYEARRPFSENVLMGEEANERERKSQEAYFEERNQEVRRRGDALILVAITDGSYDLTR